MEEFPVLEAACRHGRLVVTDESVAVRPASSLHWSRHHWQVPREKITGVSSYRGAYGRDLLVHTSDGHSRRAEAVAPQQALPIIQLLGHARMALPDDAPTPAPRRPHRWVRGGKLVLSHDAVAFKPRLLFFLRGKRHWWVPRSEVTGVLTVRQPGLRMRYDVTVLTRHGGRFSASDVSPDNVILLTRQLGHTTEAPAIPAPVRADRTSVYYALAGLREAAAPRQWTAEDGGVWEIEPDVNAAPARGWGSRVSAREGMASMRFATLISVVLVCVYLVAALLGGRAIANEVRFTQEIAAPSHARPAPAAPGLAAPVVGALNPSGSASSAAPGLAATPASAPSRSPSR